MMKRVFTLMIAIVMLLSCVIGASAIPNIHYYGDVNLDRNIDILDATLIQCHVAQIQQLSELGQDLADVDADSVVTVADATMIQKKSAKLIMGFDQDKQGIYTDVEIVNLSADFDSGKAVKGVAVTFDTVAFCIEGAPLMYEYYVDDVAVSSEKSELSKFTYVFEDEGLYEVCVRVYNKYGEFEQRSIEYAVIDKEIDDSLIISGIHANSLHISPMNEVVVTAYARGGVAPYEYRFELEDSEIVQDYGSDNQINLGLLKLGSYTVKVYVKDANGDVVERYYDFEVEEPLLM